MYQDQQIEVDAVPSATKQKRKPRKSRQSRDVMSDDDISDLSVSDEQPARSRRSRSTRRSVAAAAAASDDSNRHLEGATPQGQVIVDSANAILGEVDVTSEEAASQVSSAVQSAATAFFGAIASALETPLPAQQERLSLSAELLQQVNAHRDMV